MVVTGHVLLGMFILGASVILWLVGGGLRVADLNADFHGARQSSREVLI